MRGLKEIHIKMGAVILVFSFLLTTAFTGASLLFAEATNQTTTSRDGFYLLSKPDYEQIIENNGTLKVHTEKLMGRNTISHNI